MLALMRLFTNSHLTPTIRRSRQTGERFREGQKSGAFTFAKICHAKIRPALRLLNGHDAIVLEQRLETAVGGRFLPKRVDLGLAALLHHFGKAHRLHLQHFHWQGPVIRGG